MIRFVCDVRRGKLELEAFVHSSFSAVVREEQCLYAVKSPNYYNKHLRAEALERVASAVCVVRPYTTSKECYSKMHNLRTQFKVEHAKVKSTKSSGAGMNDIYKPSLWYYEKLMFLADHCLPRKSTAIGLTQHSTTEDNESEETCSLSSQSMDIQPSPHQNIEGCYSLDVDVLNDVCIGEQCEEAAATSPPPPPPPPPTHATQSRDGRRKRPGDGYMSAVEVIANKMCASQDRQQPSAELTMDSCMIFIGNLAKEIKSSEIKMQLIRDLVNVTTEAKLKDLQMQMQNSSDSEIV
ncbi:uncharacterized protein LOC124720185 [Schistocerca piceifrons]|uniref:uncharacterized protein LOC124720185 n=1 Tax=Schistocerca piceifrons TaxID=274613 RepID=UPI001F5F32E9|nr:uncharacterized protein LOC124720185 [Schistocerca piceifrons]